MFSRRTFVFAIWASMHASCCRCPQRSRVLLSWRGTSVRQIGHRSSSLGSSLGTGAVGVAVADEGGAAGPGPNVNLEPTGSSSKRSAARVRRVDCLRISWASLSASVLTPAGGGGERPPPPRPETATGASDLGSVGPLGRPGRTSPRCGDPVPTAGGTGLRGIPGKEHRRRPTRTPLATCARRGLAGALRRLGG